MAAASACRAETADGGSPLNRTCELRVNVELLDPPGLRLEESLRRLPLQKRLDESKKQIDLRDDGRVGRRRQYREARCRGWFPRVNHVAHSAAAEQAKHRDRMLERSHVGVAGDNEHRRIQRLHLC